ncbi:hypothetical protein Gohar_006143 [Gossypium harknessii]|uniref:Uncharacterized protein n=1 Tax=Gossypium harknessii TaxID=34285 RepID=A0A7J9GCF8_9ROSI|nr:hypothetical protein [Gossypium harknessii]
MSSPMLMNQAVANTLLYWPLQLSAWKIS